MNTPQRLSVIPRHKPVFHEMPSRTPPSNMSPDVAAIRHKNGNTTSPPPVSSPSTLVIANAQQTDGERRYQLIRRHVTDAETRSHTSSRHVNGIGTPANEEQRALKRLLILFKPSIPTVTPSFFTAPARYHDTNRRCSTVMRIMMQETGGEAMRRGGYKRCPPATSNRNEQFKNDTFHVFVDIVRSVIERRLYAIASRKNTA